MLPILFRQPENAHPLQEICPWIDFMNERIVLCKDGSLLAGFVYGGLDPEGSWAHQRNAATEQLQRALSQFDSRMTAWWIIDKRRDDYYPSNEFRNDTAAALDAMYSAPFVGNEHYTFHYNLFLLYTGNTGIDKFMDRVSRIRAEDGTGNMAAIIKAIRESVSGRNSFAQDTGMIRENMAAFERAITAFVNAAPINLRRMEYDEFCFSLTRLANRATLPSYHEKPQGSLLDGWVPMEYVATGKDTIHFQGNASSCYAAALNVIDWPQHTTPQMLESILKMDSELTFCQIIRFLNSPESTAEIQKAVEYYNLTRFSFVGHAMSKLAGKEPIAKQDKDILLTYCTAASNDVNVSGLNFAYQNTFVMIYGKTQRDMEKNADLAARHLSSARFGSIREGQNAFPTFCSMLPGQWAMQSRYELVSLANVSDIAPIYTMPEGSRTHGFFSEVFGRPVPPFTVFANAYKGRFNFSPHVGQVGHMVIIAPTGGGKTTFVNFLMSQFLRYGDVNIFVFDRNHSCKIVTELHDGTHIDIRQSARFNPFFAMEDKSEDGIIWLREFVIRRLQQGGYEPTTLDRTAIDEKLALIAKGGHSRRLSTLAALLPLHLQNQLGEWLEGRPYGMFDTDVDDFSISRWTTVEMIDIMGVDRLAMAFMDYVFRKIFVSLDGTPTLIYLEEATFLLEDARFRDAIDDWLKTFRKKNAFLWLTIQSPTAIAHQSIGAAMLDNIFTFLLLPNDRVEAHREAYKKSFGLQDHQVDLIRSLQPKRDYLLVQGTETRILHATFPPEVLAFVRSEATVLNLFDRIRAEHRQMYGPDDKGWKDKYLNAVMGERHPA